MADTERTVPQGMYLRATRRYQDVTDAVFERLAAGDVLGLLEFVADVANGCDYVDDELIAVHGKAVERWTPTS